MRKNLYVFIAILLLSLDKSFLFAQDINLSQDTGLSLEECITLALTNHPSLRKSKAATKGAAAQLEAIRARKRLTLGLTGTARYSGTYDYWDDRAHNESIALNASKLLYDTGKNKLQQEIQYETLLGSRESERNTRITVAANAKKAYYDLVLKFLNRDVEREKVKNLEQHLAHAKGLYDVGQSPYIDVTKAQADLAAAKVALMKAENDILVSQENLRVAMGTDIKGVFNIALSTQLLLPQPAQDFDALVNIALNDRPDYQKLLHDVKGSELSVKNAARTSSPTITGSAGSSVSKREGSRASNEYSVGISINIPVIDGGEEKAAIDSAKAQLEGVNADLEALKNQITASVRSAALTLINATDRVKSSQTSVEYSEENLTLAQGRYEVGVGAPLELSDAVLSLANSRLAYYQALYDAQTARADLDLALGHMPPELEVF